VEGIDVVILYPSKKVSPLQEAQLTTLGHNIRAVEVEGTFDDCQRMVKQAFLDAELRAACRLTSANSINISRLIPQSFYYFRAVTQLPDGLPPVLSVPSGNFGNLTAGVFARHMGLPVHRLIAATNSNAVFPHYLESGHFEPAPSVHTLSNAMDVGHPSNFERLQDIYHDSAEEMRREISSYAFDDAATAEKMQAVYRQYGYLLDPHGAVGLLGWEAWRAAQPTDAPGIVFETAHPAKFGEVIRQVLGIDPPLPPALAAAAARGKQATRMENNYARLKEFLLAAR
jgi:threonine synthase